MRKKEKRIYANPFLIKTTSSKVISNNHIGDGVEHELNVLCVCSACEMTVDFFLFALVLSDELRLNVFRGFGILVFALVLGKAFSIYAKKNRINN